VECPKNGAINDIHKGTLAGMRTQNCIIYDFHVTIKLYQRSTLNPYLFTFVLDVLPLRCMFFTYDIILLGESNGELNEIENLEDEIRSTRLLHE
jgi:hypothetical protein